jgi:hypothetical protein
MKLNATLRSRLEEVLKTLGYKVRYEKGNFRGGECLLEDQRIVVVNKFYPVENQVSTLIEIVLGLPVPPGLLDDEQAKLLDRLRRLQAQANTPTNAQPTP